MTNPPNETTTPPPVYTEPPALSIADLMRSQREFDLQLRASLLQIVDFIERKHRIGKHKERKKSNAKSIE
jgi:hypothetical protein